MLLFISGSEIFFILIVVVLLFGSKKIPEIAHGLGKAMQQVRNATNEIKREINDSAQKHELTKDIRQISENVSELKESVRQVVNPIAQDIEEIHKPQALPNPLDDFKV